MKNSLKERSISCKPFPLCVVFHIETSHFICSANQMIGFYIKCNTGLKKANLVSCNKFWDILNHDFPPVYEVLTLVP